MTEQELAAIVVDALTNDGWEIYQEVEVWSGGGIADIVAVRYPLVHIVECKMTYSAEVVGQADEWVRYSLAHHVSIAVPSIKRTRGWRGSRSKGRAMLDRYLLSIGIGKIQVNKKRRQVEWERSIPPKLTRKPRNLKRLRDTLTEEHKTFAQAGNAEGTRWTPFQQTCRELKRVVKNSPGITLLEAIRTLREHHYASDQSARTSLARGLQYGYVKGVRAEGRDCKLYLEEENE
jgi:hypothetical protein